MIRHPYAAPLSSRRRHGGFSLLEILVVAAILSLIVYSLLVMFNQTQRALRVGVTQVDVLDAGRAATEMVSRELEQLTAAGEVGVTNLQIRFSRLAAPLTVALPGAMATNASFSLQEFYFMTSYGNEWAGIGYRVYPTNNDSVGTLYRYSSATNSNPALAQRAAYAFLDTLPPFFPTNQVYQRVADGVVHLNLLAYDQNGRLINLTNLPPSVLLDPSGTWPSTYVEKAVPAYVELEIGVLEPTVLDRFYAQIDTQNWADPTQLQRGRDYLSRQAGRIHFFRQRIPVRTGIR